MEIYQYQYKHSTGICYLYENKTANKRFEETLKFQLSGLEIIGNEKGDSVLIKIGPGETKFIELNAIA